MTGGPRFNFSNGGLLGDKLASFKPYLIGDEVADWGGTGSAAGGPGIEYQEIVWNDLIVKILAVNFGTRIIPMPPTVPLSYGESLVTA